MTTIASLLSRMVSGQQAFIQDNKLLDRAAKTRTVREFIHSRSSKGTANGDSNRSAASPAPAADQHS